MNANDKNPVITPAVVNVIASLQENHSDNESLTSYLVQKIDEISRRMLFDLDMDDGELVDNMRALQMIRDNLLTIANPPDRPVGAITSGGKS